MFGITKWISFTVVSLVLSGCGDSSATRIPTKRLITVQL